MRIKCKCFDIYLNIIQKITTKIKQQDEKLCTRLNFM